MMWVYFWQSVVLRTYAARNETEVLDFQIGRKKWKFPNLTSADRSA